jgi:opacity protein-like surface antigen
MNRFVFLALLLVSTKAFSQSNNFEGVGFAVDYSLNVITDKSDPGGSDKSRSGIPSITADFNKAITDKILLGAYLSYDLATTDTAGSDPDARHPFEIGAKAGYAFTDTLMGYVKLGYAWTKYSSPGYYQMMHGPAYGIGAEYLLTKKIFTRVEIARQDYKKIAWSDGSADKVKIDSCGISIGYRF